VKYAELGDLFADANILANLVNRVQKQKGKKSLSLAAEPMPKASLGNAVAFRIQREKKV
jgi:hypothetical protein